MAVEQDTASVSRMLRQRQKDMLVQKEEHMKQIRQLSDELQKLFDKAPKRPRESIQEIDEKINALEFKRTTSSLPLAQEKSILRQIDSLKRVKSQCVERTKHEETIQNTKDQIDALRESLSLILGSLDELAPVLAKVELADRLQCSTNELRTVTLDCPREKARHVIGKNGANIKQIMERTSVAIDVDSDKGRIDITGSQSAVDLATKDIRRITEAIEENVRVPLALVVYLTTKRNNVLVEFREQHPVFIDVSRDSQLIRLEGLVEDVSAAKDDLLSMDVIQQSRSLTSIEAGVVLGKKGAQINKLVEDHNVSIEVNKDEDIYTVSVVGTTENVKSAMSSIDELLELNKDVTERVPVSPIVRSTLLTNGGARIKQLQKNVNETTNESDGSVFLSIDKSSPGDSSVLVKGRRRALVVAVEAVTAALKEMADSVLTIQVDPDIAPRLIGKNGGNIKKMKSQGDGVIIEVDTNGKVELFGSKNDVQVVAHTIETFMDENQVVRLDFDSSSIKPMFRALVREKSKEINAILSGMDLDEDASQIVLRGTAENNKLVADMIREYMDNNYIEDISYAEDDEDALLMGGSACIVNKMAQEFDVDLTAMRSSHVIVARGKKENVLAAKKKLSQFMHGGDGHSVSKLVVSEQAVGAVIGKGGSRRMELEDKHGGVKIFVETTSGVVTIRGLEESVDSCRTEILKIVSSVRVQETIPITTGQRAELSKPEVIRRLTSDIPVQVTLADDSVMVRGVFADVRYAVALVKAHLTGVYESRIELDSSQYGKISGACRDPSHFNRMKESTGAEIGLDRSTSSIVLRGKRGSVKKAKILVMGFLDFLLPSNFEYIKIPKAFHSRVASATSLADVAAASGASVILDRDVNAIQVQASSPEKVRKAVSIIKEKMTEAEKLVFVIPIGQNEVWIIKSIIGKGGQQINAISNSTNCKIDVSKQELTITVSGEDEESVSKAREALDSAMEKARRENVFVKLPSNSVSAFVGKAGKHIQQFATEHGVEVERVRKDQSLLRITGREDNVAAAKAAVLDWIKDWEENKAEVTVPIKSSFIPAVLGKDGSVVNAIQKDSGCRIDVDRGSSTVTIRGGTVEKRIEATQKINDIVAETQAMENERGRKKERDAEECTVKTKPEKTKQPGVPNPMEDESRKDRSAEFASQPVGLSQSSGRASKSPKKRSSQKVANEDAPLVGTAAGRNLFGLLASTSSLDTCTDDRETNIRPGLLSSTADNDTSCDTSSNGDPTDEGPVYIKSASGFAVRV